ncbi:NYN domain-containing protein [Actinopolymorpha pittospori]
MDVVTYVDGFNLYYGLRARYKHAYLWLDLYALSQRMRVTDDILAVRYFTAIVKGDPDGARRQETYLSALTSQSPQVTVARGRHKPRKPGPCTKCGTAWHCDCPREYRTYEEKLTDVALASTMIEDAANGYGDATVLVSTDSDFNPAIEAVLRVAPTRPVFIACPPGRLKQAAHFGSAVTPFHIDEAYLKSSLLPDMVTGKNGRLYARPPKWH